MSSYDDTNVLKNKLDWAKAFNRSFSLPLDRSSMFASKADADKYALGDGSDSRALGKTSYVGQIITVYENGSVAVYVIGEDRTLIQLAAGGSVEDVSKALSSEISSRISADTDLSTSLSVTVEALETAETGYLSSYVIKQGGNQVGAKINIPKDKVFESAYMVNVSCEPVDATKETVSAFVVSYDTTVIHVLSDDTAVEPETSIAKGTFESIRNAYYGNEGGVGPYLRITVSHQDCPLYIAMPKLVDTYVGGNTDTISVNVENRTITAVVRDSSISAAQIKDGEITSAKIAADAVITDKIADDAVTNAKIADNAVDTAQLCANAVTTAKIADGNVTKAKLALEVSSWVESRVSAALSDANAYTDEQISGLTDALSAVSSEIMADLGVEVAARKAGDNQLCTCISNISVSLSTDYTGRIKAAIETLDKSDTAEEHKFVTAVSETDGVISVSRSTITSADVSGLNDRLADVESTVIGTAEDLSDANTIYGAKKYADQKIANLDKEDTAEEHKFVTAVSETDGIISVSRSVITSADISDLGNRLSDLEAAANKYTDDAIGDLDAEFTGSADKTLKYVKQVDGKISAEYQDIAIAQSQVTNLGTDLDEIRANLSGDGDGSVNDRISALCSDLSGAVDKRLGDLSGTVDVRFVQLSSVKDSSEISETNLIVTQKDIAALTGVMHFKGVAISTALSTGSTTIPKPPYKDDESPVSGDFVIDMNGTEFVWAISTDAASTQCWFKVGDETLYAKKADLDIEVQARKDADTTISNLLSSVSSTIEAEIAAEVTDRKLADTALSNDYNSQISNEISARKAGDEWLSAQVSAAIANYLSAIYLNGFKFEMANHEATLSVGIISCGNAEPLED